LIHMPFDELRANGNESGSQAESLLPFGLSLSKPL